MWFCLSVTCFIRILWFSCDFVCFLIGFAVAKFNRFFGVTFEKIGCFRYHWNIQRQVSKTTNRLSIFILLLKHFAYFNYCERLQWASNWLQKHERKGFYWKVFNQASKGTVDIILRFHFCLFYFAAELKTAFVYVYFVY